MSETNLKPLIPSELVPALNPIVVVDGSGLEKLRHYLYNRGISVFAKDYETNIVDNFFHRRARVLQIGDRDEQYIIDLMAFAETRDRLIAAQGNFWHRLDESFKKILRPVIDVVRPAFESNSHLKVGTNLQFEYVVSKWCLGMRSWNFYDLKMVEACIHAGRVDFFAQNFWGLEDMVARYAKLQIDKTAQQQDWLKEEPLSEEDIIYCALDVRLPFPVKSGQSKILDTAKLHVVAQIENDAIPAYGDMEINGFYLNPEAWMKLYADQQEEFKEAVAGLDEFFVPLVGEVPDLPTQEELDTLEAAWRDLGNNKSAEEIELTAQMKATKDKEQKAELHNLRLVAEKKRRAAREEARARFQAKNTLFTKKATEDRAKMEGKANINYQATEKLRQAMLKGGFGLTEKNLPSTNDKVLDGHAEKPIIKALRRYRKVRKSLGTYGTRWTLTRDQKDEKGKEGYRSPDTGRIHANFVQYGAETGRSTCSDPNLFNLPRDDRYRACFEATPGYSMSTIDAAGQELCILADYAGEPSWIDAFNKGWDVHSMCAEIFNGTQWKAAAAKGGEEYFDPKKKKTVTLEPCAYYINKQKCSCPEHKEMRDVMKAVNFGVPYGLSAYALAGALGISVDEAEDLLNRHKQLFPILWEFLESAGKEALARLEARSKSNRRRRFKAVSWEQAKEHAADKNKDRIEEEKRTGPTDWEINKSFRSIQGSIQREGKNMKIQGTGADQMKRAFGCGFDENGAPYLWHRLEPEFGGLQVNFVYDELVFEAPHDPNAQLSPFFKGPLIEGEVQFEKKLVSKHVKTAFDVASEAISRAGNSFVKSVPMRTEGHIDGRWRK